MSHDTLYITLCFNSNSLVFIGETKFVYGLPTQFKSFGFFSRIVKRTVSTRDLSRRVSLDHEKKKIEEKKKDRKGKETGEE